MKLIGGEKPVKDYQKVLVNPEMSLGESMKQLDKGAMQILIVVDEQNRILGVVTDGDIRRAIIKSTDFNVPVKTVMNANPIFLTSPVNKKKALALMQERSINRIPVVNKQKQVVGIILREELFESQQVLFDPKDTPVVIMAGGKGTRLDPFTKILPKPLIPVGDKPIIEIVMDKFKKFGFNKFLVSVNYKAEIIKMYFAENLNDCQIEYIEEKEFLGTAGALALARDRLKQTFIISNCDVITDADFDSFLNYHKENGNHATMCAVVRQIKIPYGVLEIKNGDLEKLVEKPEFSYIINTGIYILEPEVVDLIPKGSVMNMPDLLVMAKEKGYKVQVYPMSCSWFDVGEWEEYQKAVDFIKGNRTQLTGN